MSVDKIKKSSLGTALLLVSFSSQTWAIYSNVGTMLYVLAPTAAVTAPELNALIIAIQALPTTQQQLDALQTLIPSADGSLIAASEGPMRQMQMVLFDRLIKVTPNSGVSSGDPQKVKKDPKTNVFKKEDKSQQKPTKKKELKKKESKKKDSQNKQDNTTNEASLNEKQDKAKESIEESVEEEENNSESEDATPCISDKGVWFQFLGNNTGQNWKDNVPGYDADVFGILIGRDKFTSNFMYGIAGGYVHADVNSRGPSGSFLDIKRFQGTLYGGYNCNCFFVNGALTFAKNDYDNNRKILVPPFGGVPFVRIAWSGFSAWETNAFLETGFNWVKGQFHAIPQAIFSYSHFDVEDYVEKDAFELDLNVNYHNMDFFPCGVGLKLEYQNEFEHAFVTPEVHAYAFHYFTKDPQTATALFTGGGFEFLSQGAPFANNSYEIGASIAVDSDVNTGVVIQYDYAKRDDYHRHQAFIKVRHEWA